MDLQSIISGGFGYQNVKVLKQEQVNKTSVFGTPVWGDLTIDSFKYKTSSNAFRIVQGIYVPCVIIEPSGSKKIIKTEIQGLNTKGTVKEYINHGDVSVNIKGVIANDKSNEYPQSEVEKLMDIIKAPVSIKVNHKFLNNYLEVFNLVIESYSFPNKQGMKNIQLFELNCVSDEPIELINK